LAGVDNLGVPKVGK